MAIPRGGTFNEEEEKGSYGPVFRKRSPATTSRSSRKRSRAAKRPSARMRRLEETLAALPDGLAILKLHYLRCVLLDIGKYT
jgi:hypothetical protein